MNREFTDKNMRAKNIKQFFESFIGKLDPEVTVEEILIRNNYISAKLKGQKKRKKYYYYLEAGIFIETARRSQY